MNAGDILLAISNLSEKHILKTAPTIYQQKFAEAAIRTYPPNDCAKILQEKFFIPNDAAFDRNVYIQSASELSVQNHLMLQATARNVSIEKQVNPPKNVEVYYEVESTKVSLEVKCAIEPKTNDNNLIIKMAGRVPNFRESFHDLKSQLEAANPEKKVELGKNKDNTLKDFLTSAHDKFSPQSGFDDLNVLLVSCGYHFNIQQWYFYMFEREGLFTESSFWSPSEYALVDLVILTNLKYFHEAAREHHDWTLNDVFILPILNPRRRPAVLSDSIINGLRVFNHHLKRFNEFTPKSDDPRVPDYILNNVKIGSYVEDHLPEDERRRYFPIKLTTNS